MYRLTAEEKKESKLTIRKLWRSNMMVGWTTLAVGAVLLFIISVEVATASARVCYLSTEPNPADGGRTRFVLSTGDPCTCTEVRLGGHVTHPIPRSNPPVYLDNLSAVSVDGVRSSQGCAMREPTAVPAIATSGPDQTQAGTPSDPESTPVFSTSAPQPPRADCQEFLDAGQTTSGVYTIQHAGQKMQVYCQMRSGKGYIVFQRRLDGSESFDRNWQEYTEGFGNLTGEFWLGNQNLRALTEPPSETWELLITLTSFSNEEEHVHYGDFSISGDRYALDVDDYDSSGQAGDSLTDSHQRFFTTRDQDNDDSGGLNCAETFKGGWWYKKCKALGSNLNGLYYSSPSVGEYFGIQWVSWKGETYSLKSCEMKMRRNPTLSGHVGG
ncbi:fibrinogen-like protein 1 [Patiria miniata]|uniref:Fibrinogen C-terminal domain-containing protein n=1 Tax=Patiria miniata TaxID=46514 RepID=A0A914ASG2_PATMI|nr:fibrinogen-like protein 1 [Patiria miniata]